MREEPINLVDDPVVNEGAPNGVSNTRSKPSSSGFTAVNGDSQRSSSFQPDDRARRPVSSRDPDSCGVGADVSHQHSHGWRPAEQISAAHQADLQRDAAGMNKRKRSSSDEVEGSDKNTRASHFSDESRQSPKRRMTERISDSAIVLSPPASASQRSSYAPTDRRQPERHSVGPYYR